MYAVFKSGGKQYRVSKGEKLKLEKLETDVGKKVVFDQVLSVGEGKDINIGTPYLANTVVEAKVLDLSLIHICRCRRIERCRSRWSPYH